MQNYIEGETDEDGKALLRAGAGLMALTLAVGGILGPQVAKISEKRFNEWELGKYRHLIPQGEVLKMSRRYNNAIITLLTRDGVIITVSCDMGDDREPISSNKD